MGLMTNSTLICEFKENFELLKDCGDIFLRKTLFKKTLAK